ncbi:hypothetical protein NQ042_06580, partial [Corynebacterium phoceense]|uniref:hypothetical protein n=1 Tax=Corynebacterium phoceense TaxID=1686286 RepID=UPI00211CB0C1
NTKAKRTNRLASYVAKRKETIWHIQKLHKINNTDPTPDGAKKGASTPSQTNAITVYICTDKQT